MVSAATFASSSFLRSLCVLRVPFSFSDYVVVLVSKVLHFLSVSTLFQSPFCFSLAVSVFERRPCGHKRLRGGSGNVDGLGADGCYCRELRRF